MFTVHYKDGKVYLVFANEDDITDFMGYFLQTKQKHILNLALWNGEYNAIEFVPIIDAATEHQAALEHGKLWDNDKTSVHSVGTDA